MCGIVGYIGRRSASEIILNGLKHLEYRGYDSAGIATVQEGKIETRRRAGKLINLANHLKEAPLSGNVGIGHTRWATHGSPTEDNAHPHTDCRGEVVVVHNGIIENYLTLKQELQKEGHVFRTETDTEVLAHLVEKYNTGSLEDAVRKTLGRLEGAYAVVFIHSREARTVIAARQGPPLVIGYGDSEYFVASDIPAILSETRQMYFLDDGEIAVLTPDGVSVTRLTGEAVAKQWQQISWDPVQAEKAGYKHFMLKEIFEQPTAIEDTIRGRINRVHPKIILDSVHLTEVDVHKINRILLIACGTSWHSALVGKFLIEDMARIPCEVDIGSEFRYRNPLVDENTLTIVLSQSGETADTLAAEKEAKSKGSRILAICNVVGSMMTRLADDVLYTHAGPEIGVASTKAFTTQLVALYLIALHLGSQKKLLSETNLSEKIEALAKLPKLIKKVLECAPLVEKVAQQVSQARDCLYLGRGINYPIGLEGALKLKEISYLHAEGYPAGEMKHGPIALIDKDVPVILLTPFGRSYQKILSNLEEAKARGGQIIVLAAEGDKAVYKMADWVIPLPLTTEHLMPIVLSIPLQLLAYYVAVLRGNDVDQPRNLAKSVTVE